MDKLLYLLTHENNILDKIHINWFTVFSGGIYDVIHN